MSDAALVDKDVDPAPDPAPAPDPKPAAPAPAPAPPPDAKAPPIATGKDAPPAPAEKPYWPADWRDKIAGTSDKRNPLRRTLETLNDPAAVANSMMELRRRWDEGGHVKLPGEKATDDERAAFHKALGVPEKPEGYIDHVKLDNGAVIGDADKPIVDYFAGIAHKAGMPPSAFNAIVNGWYAREEEQAAALDDADEAFRMETEQALREEYGPTFGRYRNAISSLFTTMPGGSSAEDSFFANLVGGRTADGKVIGNHPDFIKWAVGLVREINPHAAVTEQADGAGQTIDTEIAAIERRMKEDRRGYFKDETAQARLRELYEARDKIRARSAA